MNLLQEWIFFFRSGLNDGLKVTLVVLGVSIVTTLVWGGIVALMRLSKIKLLRSLSTAYIEIFRGTPILLQILILFALLPQLTGIFLAPFTVAIMAITLNAGGYMAESYRSGFESVPVGLQEAATALGMRNTTTLWRVRLPIMLSITMPAIGNVIVQILLTTPFVFLVGIQDLMSKAHELMTKVADFSVYLFVTVIYVCLGLLISWLNSKIEKRIRIPGL